MRIRLFVLCLSLWTLPHAALRASDESAVDLPACQPAPRASTDDARRDAFLGRLDAVRCQEGALRGAWSTPAESDQRGIGEDQGRRWEVQAQATSHNEGPDAPLVRLSASAVDEGRALEVRWEIEGEVTHCVAEGDHPLWSGIDAGAQHRQGSWRHYPTAGERTDMRISMRCEHEALSSLSTLIIDASPRPY